MFFFIAHQSINIDNNKQKTNKYSQKETTFICNINDVLIKNFF